jgi:predicted glycoside hydrolase/deacetylase ChbG (UPF0249 family)
MSTLRDFLNWFEGISENIEENKAPSPKQWARIKEKLLALRDSKEGQAVPAPVAAPVQAGVDPVPGGATVTAKWKETVKKTLEETLGYDPESSAEIMGHPSFVVDLNMDPVAAAHKAAGVMN